MPHAEPAAPDRLVRFFRIIEDARMPQRADRSAAGTLPTRASRYCDAVTTASAYGWYIFPPMAFSLVWDGADLRWSFDGSGGWLPLDAAQYPGLADRFDAAAPEALQGCAPPFLTALPEPGAVQIWSGLFAQTATDWSLLVRAPANLPLPGGYAQYEGMVETDRWFGPLFTNLRLTRTDMPVRFRADFPLIQVQPLPRHAYAEATLADFDVVGHPSLLGAAEWAAYNAAVVAPNTQPDRPAGQFAVAARRRRKSECPHAR